MEQMLPMLSLEMNSKLYALGLLPMLLAMKQVSNRLSLLKMYLLQQLLCLEQISIILYMTISS
ncbi:MAG: hypothetical protein CMJ52_09565 [Planctomycetaceae bacterium]|nr:hypothetical protein [Planctomycetaceae bacterium]